MYSGSKRRAGQGMDHIARKFQILTALYDERYLEAAARNDEHGLTLGKIAKKIGVSRSPHLRRLLETLYLEGAVVMKEYPYRKNVTRNVWIITNQARWLAAYCPLFDAYLGEEVKDA